MPKWPSILHVIHSGAVGGGPRVVLDLVTRLPGRQAVATAADGPLIAAVERARIETCTLRFTGEFSFGLSIPQLARLGRTFDIIHLHGQFAAFYGSMAALFANVPTVYTAHFPSFVTDSTVINRLRNHVAEWIPCQLSSRIVTCSNTSRLDYLNRKLAKPQSIRTIYNGVSLEAPARSPDVLRRDLGLSDGPVVLGMGRFTAQKGFDLLIDAFELVLQQIPTANLVLVGDGEERPAMERQVSDNRMTSAVRFTGFQSDVAGFLNLATVVAVPSRYDIFPLVPLEAMMAGRPVVATDLPLFREAVVDRETGILSALGQKDLSRALLDILADPGRGAQMGAAGKERAGTYFTVNRMVREYTALYDDLWRVVA